MSSGVYKIQSKIHPDRCYIGSSVHIEVRWQEHLRLLLNNRHSYKLQRHYNKYGKEDLMFFIVLECESKKDVLLIAEQIFIDVCHPFFNVNPLACSNLGSKSSEETKKKIGDAGRGKKRTVETRLKMSIKRKLQTAPMLGKHHSEETKQKMSKSAMGKSKPHPNRPQTEATKEKLRIANLGKIKGPHSLETKQKMSIAQKGKIKGPLSEEHKRKISMAITKLYETKKLIS
jgi:group I intron endonuclease